MDRRQDDNKVISLNSVLHMILVVLGKTWFPQDIGTAQYPGGCFLVIEENVCLEYNDNGVKTKNKLTP